MKDIKGMVVNLLVDHFGNDYRRITHALEVLKYAEMITEKEQKIDYDYDILVTVALLHDIGIKQSEIELGYNNGRTQEIYGPPEAESLLQKIGFPVEKTKKVCEIIGNHHSKSRYDYVELKILKKADKIVNEQDKD